MLPTPLRQFTQENIGFLTTNLEVSTSKLASLAQIDESSLCMFQTYGYPMGKVIEPMDDLIKLCNYFTIHLGDLLYTDIENSVFDKSIFTKLKDEMHVVAQYDREPFKKKLLESYDSEQEEMDKNQELSAADNLKLVLNNIQRTFLAHSLMYPEYLQTWSYTSVNN